MDYVVEVCYGDRNEWSNEFDKYSHACQYAYDMSKLAGVGEARIYQGDEHIMTYVDGEEQLPDWNEWDDDWDEPYDPLDEVGYDPYTGGYDMDL